MNDDHGTLRDERGEPKVYRGIASAEGPSCSLSEAMIWPETMSDWQAIGYAAQIEFGRAMPGSLLRGPVARRTWCYVGLRSRLPLQLCHEDHTADRCPSCGAER